MFLNTWNWYWVERTCFWISSFDSASSNAVRISYTATHTQELLYNILLHGERTVSNHDRFILQFQAKFYLLFTPTRLWQVSLGDQYHYLFQIKSDLFVWTPINQNPCYPKQIARNRFLPMDFTPLIRKPRCPTPTWKLRNGYVISIEKKTLNRITPTVT